MNVRVESGHAGLEPLRGSRLYPRPIGRGFTRSLLKWWDEQGKEARGLLRRTKNVTSGVKSLPQALAEFQDWFNQSCISGGNKYGPEVWANDPSFDCEILKAAFKTQDMQPLWKHYDERSCRTIISLHRSILKSSPKKDLPFEGVPHHALHDARHQVKYVSTAYQNLSRGR
ncbi:MAG: 3'-5' exoribonuclease [Marinobacterium sp.]|nr:3'-5' exoribonuclease [Marinobacterium sp.]